MDGQHLLIELRKETPESFLPASINDRWHRYTSASVNTRDTASWTYGRFEVMAKMPQGKGTWPALWFLCPLRTPNVPGPHILNHHAKEIQRPVRGPNNGESSLGEIDLLESWGSRDPNQFAVHIFSIIGPKPLVTGPADERIVYALSDRDAVEANPADERIVYALSDRDAVEANPADERIVYALSDRDAVEANPADERIVYALSDRDAVEANPADERIVYNESHRNGKTTWYPGAFVPVDDMYNKFHLYAMEWYPDHMDFFLDTNKILTYTKNPSGDWAYHRPMYLIMNIACGGPSEPAPDDSNLPQLMTVDYVRVYQKK